MSQGLFRQEVIDARRGEWLGSIIVAAPLSRWLLTLLASLLATAILLFLFFGHYTSRETVAGTLVPSAGLLNVEAPSAGTVTKLHVSFGADPDKVAAASKIVVQDLKQMQHTPVTETELKRAKGILLRQIPLGESSFGAIGGQLLTLSQEGKPLDAMTIAGEHYLKLTAQDVQ